MSDRQTQPIPADTDIEPLVTFDEDHLFWIVACPSPACPKAFADVRLSVAMRRYREHRDLPAFALSTLTADLLAV